MSKDINISPIFYMGNKKKLIKKGLIDLFPKDISTFVDLFSGSSIVSMNVDADKYMINDINPNLVELYNLFKTQNSDVIINHINSRIDSYGLARERTKRNEFKDVEKIKKYKESYMSFRKHYNENKNTLDFYTLMFYSFSQQFRFNSKGDFNMPCGNDCFAESNHQYIKNGCKFFSKDNVYIFNKNFEELNIDNLSKDDFIYLDPPYLNTVAVYNENGGWGLDDENKLYNFIDKLNQKGIRFALSNILSDNKGENTTLKKYLETRDYKVYSFDKFTYMACGKGNQNSKEVLITNY